MLSIGFSNVSQEFCAPDPADPCKPWSFTGQALANSHVNKTTLAIVNGAAPSQDAATWTDPDMDNYNRILRDQLIPAGLSEAQVQAVWVKFANVAPTESLQKLASDALRLLSQAGQTMRTLKIRYPNLRIVILVKPDICRVRDFGD